MILKEDTQILKGLAIFMIIVEHGCFFLMKEISLY